MAIGLSTNSVCHKQLAHLFSFFLGSSLPDAVWMNPHSGLVAPPFILAVIILLFNPFMDWGTGAGNDPPGPWK